MSINKIDLSSKEDCIKLVSYTVTSMQKWRSIYMENNETAGIYNRLIKEDGRYDKYLLAFMKMEELGGKIQPMNIVNLLYYINVLYPAIGIIMVANMLDVPDFTSIQELLSQMKWNKEEK